MEQELFDYINKHNWVWPVEMFNFADRYKTIEIIKMAMRYEIVRKFNVVEFSEVYKRNLSGERFDDIIDELIKE